MTNVELKIWGRQFNLPIVYDWFEDEEELLPSQNEAVKNLSANHQMIDNVLQNAQNYVMQFALNETKVDNIFKYIIPKKIYVLRKENPSFALFCDFKFDLEHGIALVFENNRFSAIVSQDEVL